MGIQLCAEDKNPLYPITTADSVIIENGSENIYLSNKLKGIDNSITTIQNTIDNIGNNIDISNQLVEIKNNYNSLKQQVDDIEIPEISEVPVVASFKSIVFRRTNGDVSDPPENIQDNYNTFNKPLPSSEWSDTIPDGDETLWATSRIFYSDESHSGGRTKWSTPVKMTDTADFEVMYSPNKDKPDMPGGFKRNGINIDATWLGLAKQNGWYDDVDFTGDAIWMATNKAKNGDWQGWEISKIKGENGKDGTSITIIGSVESTDELPKEGAKEGDCYIFDGNLYVWDGNNWNNVGQFKGDPGKSAYIHIKYANQIDQLDTSNQRQFEYDSKIFELTESDGEVIGDYMGIFYDDVEESPANTTNVRFKKYKWHYWRGVSNYRLDLDNQYDSIIYNDNDEPISGNITAKATLYYGKDTIDSDITYAVSPNPSENEEYYIDIHGTLTVTKISGDKKSITVKATYDNTTYQTTMTVVKLINETKYELNCSPSAVSYNLSTNCFGNGNTTQDITIAVYKTTVENGILKKTLVENLEAEGLLLYNHDDEISNNIIKLNSDSLEPNIVLKRNNVLIDSETIPINKTINGDNGADGADGVAGPMLYPAGEWDSSINYEVTKNSKGDIIAKPIVYYKDNYYVLDANDSIDTAPDTGDWKKFEKIEYLFTEVLMANWAKLAQAVFWGNYMFSQKGIANGLSNQDYSQYTGNMFQGQVLSGNFIPNLFLDFMSGTIKTNKMSETFKNFDYRSKTLKDVNNDNAITNVNLLNTDEGYNVIIDPNKFGYPIHFMLCMPLSENITDGNNDSNILVKKSDWEPDGMKCCILVRENQEWLYISESALDGKQYSELTMNDCLDRGVVLCADARIFHQKSYKIDGENTIYLPSRDYNELNNYNTLNQIKSGGYFVVNGHITKFLIVEPGTIVNLRSANVSIDGRSVLLWYVENSDLFSEIKTKVNFRPYFAYNKENNEVCDSTNDFAYEYGYQTFDKDIRNKVFGTKTYGLLQDIYDTTSDISFEACWQQYYDNLNDALNIGYWG